MEYYNSNSTNNTPASIPAPQQPIARQTKNPQHAAILFVILAALCAFSFFTNLVSSKSFFSTYSIIQLLLSASNGFMAFTLFKKKSGQSLFYASCVLCVARLFVVIFSFNIFTFLILVGFTTLAFIIGALHYPKLSKYANLAKKIKLLPLGIIIFENIFYIATYNLPLLLDDFARALTSVFTSIIADILLFFSIFYLTKWCFDSHEDVQAEATTENTISFTTYTSGEKLTSEILAEYKEQLRNGEITQEEYEERKNKLLS